MAERERATFTAIGDTRRSLLEHARSIAESFYGDLAYTIVNVDAHPHVVEDTGRVILWEPTVKRGRADGR